MHFLGERWRFSGGDLVGKLKVVIRSVWCSVFLGYLHPRSVVRRNLCWRGVKLCLSDPCCRAMDRKGGNAAGSSSQGRSAWGTPLQSKPQTQLDGPRSSGPAGAAISTKMLVKNAPLSFSSKPAVQNPVYSSSDDDSESGGEGGTQSRNINALESSIMADYPSTEDMDDTGAVFSP